MPAPICNKKSASSNVSTQQRGADFAEQLRLLDNRYWVSCTSNSNGCCQATETSSNNSDLKSELSHGCGV